MQGCRGFQPSPSPVWTTEKYSRWIVRDGSWYGRQVPLAGGEIEVHLEGLAGPVEGVPVQTPTLQGDARGELDRSTARIAEVQQCIGVADAVEGEAQLPAPYLAGPAHRRGPWP